MDDHKDLEHLSFSLISRSCPLSGMEEEEEERKELISLLVLTAHRMEKEKEKRMSGESSLDQSRLARK